MFIINVNGLLVIVF